MIIVFDIGGTNMRLAVSKDGTTLDRIEKIPTPKSFEDGMNAFTALAFDLTGGQPVTAAAGGIAGTFDKDSGCLLYSPHLIEWSQHNIVEELQKRLRTEHIYFQNDASLVGLGEAHVGAGKGYGIVAYITVSTGVGGSRIVNGSIDVSAHGFEPGHSIIEAREVVSGGPAPIPGTIESYISGTYLQKQTGIAPWETVTPEYAEVWDTIERYLVYFVNNVAVFWSPDAIVIGGSMIVKKTMIDVGRVEQKLSETLTVFQSNPKILRAALADDGGLQGALVYASQRLQATA